MTASSASFLFQIQDLTARFVPSLSDRVSERFCVSALLFRFPGQMEEQGLQAVVFPCKRDFFLMDLVQEGNVGLLVALESVVKAETAEQAIDAAVRETISDFMEEHRVQKHKDNTVVNKVNRLKDAIEELSDGDDMDFSVAELSAYLDMSVEEIEDILRIAGEEP